MLAVRGVSGDWVEVVSGRYHHCAAPLRPKWAEVRLFVPLSALAHVNRDEFFAEYEDGTRVRLSAGLPVGDETVRVVLTDDWLIELPVELPAPAIGLSYRHHDPMIVSGPDGGEIGPTTDAKLGGKRFEVSESVDLLGGTPTPHGFLVGIVGRCVDASILVSQSDVVPPAVTSNLVRDGSRVVEISELPDEAYTETQERVYTVAAGSEIRWPSGGPAGTVVATAAFYEEPERVRGMVCWNPPTAPWTESARFCFDPRDVETHETNIDVEP